MNTGKITLDTLHPSWLPQQPEAAMLRLDKLDAEISGNKWFKLKYNLEAARSEGKTHILTFGGAYSNHIAATAAACRQAGLPCTGIIRGEAPQVLSHTLETALAQGMQLEFVSREAYKNNCATFEERPDTYVIPEGGHNAAGARGCEEILSLFPTGHFTHILCAVGTGTTLAGLINSATPDQTVIGIPVLKGAGYLEAEVKALLYSGKTRHWQLLHDFHGGGYAKVKPALIDFINTFFAETGIPTDIIYTGKLVYAFHELIRQRYFTDNNKVLLIHTGGLQGNLSLPPGVLSL
ncbi:1-aminocyclopropane-1-carboxylate deaminase/D-cysteine desulfhydrase [Chitinophaga qingshengii]|uniref:Pyridoxal-phosphate dependent enzyme n=1 Tax=Chitinophaga qingshengii TaxID=1569794 RepID=A0ABR7TPW2_9BACT|nr:pyridoxal-phosphate dependent enzyme [Chitinophaga qingshengii]MBC9932512.1 pyridoxal-phosphate dependent enzyme [Chitinophaga qingshengii]